MRKVASRLFRRHLSNRSESCATPPPDSTRREFLQKTAVWAAGAVAAQELALTRSVHAAARGTIRIGLIGAGGRGAGAAINALENVSYPDVKLVAIADAFAEPLQRSLKAIQARCPQKVDVPADRQFVGLDAYEKVLACEVDLVVLCSPPGFRPVQFESAVKAGKHIFMEKPVATDAPGYRRILAANELAKQKKLAVAVGHHLRHETKHREIIQRIHDGAIGQLQYLRAYYNASGVWFRPRKQDQTEMQFQVSNWYYFVWLSGDHIVEQHVHDLDVMNWMMKDAHPVEAQGMGGRQVRTPEWAEAQGMGRSAVGEIFDHHAVEFSYPDGTKMYSFCRHQPGTWQSFSEHAHGTQGRAAIEGHGASQLWLGDKKVQEWRREKDGHQVEMDDLFAALNAGQDYNEGAWAANSSMTAILGRMATYSGQVVRWDDATESQLDLSPQVLAWDAQPQPKPLPDGSYPCAIPGTTKAW